MAGAQRTGGRDIVVMGASAGGIEAFQTLFGAVRSSLEASLFIALHRASGQYRPDSFDDLPSLLSTPNCPVKTPFDGEPIRRGQAYLAPVDMNMLVERGRIRVEESPKEHLNRPSINALFRSAALAYGRRVVGVILSGGLEDGIAGLWQIKQRGGIAVVQDPAEAQSRGMPQSAIQNVKVDYCARLSEIGLLLATLTARRPSPPPTSGFHPGRILIVEDELIVAMNLEKRLKVLGYQVCGTVSSGEDALTAVESTDPDLVLMDIRLPGEIDGTETARIIWEQFQLPVVFVTAYADDETIDKVKRVQSYGYVMKPFNPVEVHAVIQVALERRDKEMIDLGAP
jgi:chemotaxis response regulator CheB